MDDQAYRERLGRDLEHWRRDGIIDETQERAMLARAGAGTPGAVRALRLGWLVTAVSVVGALVLGGGVLLLIGTNWDTLPDALRTGLLLASIFASYGVGYALLYRFDMQRIGSAFFLLGYLLYVAAVFLIPQIYSMPTESPWLVLLAAVGAFPLAYLFESRIVLLLGIAGIVAWVFDDLVRRYPDEPEAEAALIIIGALAVGLYAVGRMHIARRLERFGEVYMLAGLLVLLGLVYQFTFRQIWRSVIDTGVESYAAPNLVYVAIGLAAIAALGQWLMRGRGTENNIEGAILAGVLVTGAVVATWPAWTGYALVFNLIFFAIAAGLVARGYLQGDERQVNLGLLVVAIGLLTRYVDIFWSVMGRSAFFMVGGAILLVLAFGLERLRRSLLAGMDDGAETGAPGDAAEATR